MPSFQERCWQNLDKLILCFLFLVTLGSAIWIQFVHGSNEGSLDWARHNTDLVLAGLLGLMGGRAWAAHVSPVLDSTQDKPPLNSDHKT